MYVYHTPHYYLKTVSLSTSYLLKPTLPKMLAFVPVLLLAATAVARPDSAATSIRALSVEQAAQKCENRMRLVCCNRSDDCAEIELEG